MLTDLEWGAEMSEPAAQPASEPAAPGVGAAPLDLQRQRDELLMHDGVRMLLRLLGPPEQPAEAAPCLSPQLRAVCSACATSARAPSLRQLLSHPYFRPLEGFQRHDVQLAFQRYSAGAHATDL